ncbi:hypothetical protein GIB67_028219 [Kingdonia uniflora]|uniref:Kinesin motor domain-containing protein n=1 Tax=Kingdonia uniflora TaxID=39325 RepID=A0A7J7KZ86_9MAGN|nr:hypothetical protein GIB67_028219 [Kingdonia uniflora]
MIEFQCEPTDRSYVIVFSILSENQFKLAQMFHKYMKQVGVPPSVSFLNVFIKALCMKRETVDDALRVFREIPDHGCIPDSYTYGTLINGLCKLGKISEAKELFEEMDAKDCSPTVVTYTSLIHGPCLSNILDEAMELLEEMSRKRIEPNMVTFSSLMDELCKGGEGKVPDAVQILDRMKLQGLKPDGVLYGRLVNSLCNSSMFQEVANLLDVMVPGGMLPIHGDVYKASQIVNEMLLEGSIPDEWNAVVCGFLHRTKVKEATDVTMKGVLFHTEETSVFNMKEQVFTKQVKDSGVLNGSLKSRSDSLGLYMPLVYHDRVVVAYACKRQLAGQACASAVDRTRAILMEMLDQSGGASSIADSLTTPVVNDTGLTLPTLPILGLTLLGLALDPSLVGLPATSQSIPVLIVPEGFYSVIVDEVIREEVYLFVESHTLGDIFTVDVVVGALVESILDQKENIDHELVASFRNGNTVRRLLSKILPGSLQEPLNQRREYCRSCSKKDSCIHWCLVEVQEKDLMVSLFILSALSFNVTWLLKTLRVQILHLTGNGGLSHPDATMHLVKSTNDILNLMKLGEMNRFVSSTALNNRSSHSHSILTIHVQGKDSSGSIQRCCLHRVDLAGSERVDKSEVTAVCNALLTAILQFS